MPSTVIRRFVYDPGRRQLWVEFVTGRRYVYEEVPEEIAATFASTFSKGVYFNTRIRDQFKFREIIRDDEATHS